MSDEPEWKKFQDEVATFYKELGLDAKADVSIEGVRTKHDIDVLVKSCHAGFDITWLIECKKWKTKITKLHVLALREIINDTGADKGIIISESGFQSGAIEAANLTNIELTSLAETKVKSENDINAMRLRELYDRVEACKVKYWDIPKKTRIEYGLRPEVGFPGYSGAFVVQTSEELLRKAFRNNYPIEPDEMKSEFIPSLPEKIESSRDMVALLSEMILELENKITEVGKIISK